MSGGLMIYGAYGYTGELVARRAVAIGLKPLLAGRNASKLQHVATELGLDAVAVDISDGAALRDALGRCTAVVNCAGPFNETWGAMTAACLETGTHYLDITGEIAVFEGCTGLDAAARAAGITIMPGVGFDVVPTDCMAAMLKAGLPDASAMTLGIAGMAQASRGTARTSVPYLAGLPLVRKNGALVETKGALTKEIDFGRGPETAHAISWGDVATAWYTTGIPNIEVFMKVSPEMAKLIKMPMILRKVLASPLGAPLVRSQLRKMPAGPNAAQRAAGRCVIVGRAENDEGDVLQLRLETPEGYELTGILASEIGGLAASGQLPPGFQTPAKALGPDFILKFDGCAMLD